MYSATVPRLAMLAILASNCFSDRAPLDLALGIGGVANTRGSVHESIAALIRHLIQKSTAQIHP
jgi:hypothetical protein